MLAHIKNNYKFWVILLNAMILPGMYLCRWLTDQMLATDNPCVWTLLGGRCIACGGTHFVNDLCNFRFLTALQDNPYLFILTVFLAASILFLDLWLLFGKPYFKKLLNVMYNIPSLVIWLCSALLFLLARNIPVFTQLVQVLTQQ